MLIEYVVVFENMLPYVEIPSFNLLLNAGDTVGNERRLHDGFVVWGSGSERRVEHGTEPVTSEYPHDIVRWCNHELGEARISLTSGTSSELIVDSSGFVFFRSDNVESAERIFIAFIFDGSRERNDFWGNLDVGSTSRHIGRDGYGTELSSLGDDVCFVGILFRIQYSMRNTEFGQFARKEFGFGYGNGTDENRLSFPM